MERLLGALYRLSLANLAHERLGVPALTSCWQVDGKDATEALLLQISHLLPLPSASAPPPPDAVAPADPDELVAPGTAAEEQEVEVLMLSAGVRRARRGRHTGLLLDEGRPLRHGPAQRIPIGRRKTELLQIQARTLQGEIGVF
jgi:hypothetical protein